MRDVKDGLNEMLRRLQYALPFREEARIANYHLHSFIASTSQESERLIRDGRGEDGVTICSLRQDGQTSDVASEMTAPSIASASRITRVEKGECEGEIQVNALCAAAEVIQHFLPGRDIRVSGFQDLYMEGQRICRCVLTPSVHFGAPFQAQALMSIRIDLALAPSSSRGLRPTTLACAPAASVGEFLTQFEHTLVEVLAHYRQERDFHPTLKRLGMLNATQDMTVWPHNARHPYSGRYAGFSMRDSSHGPMPMLQLHRNNRIEIFPLAAHSEFFGPHRSTMHHIQAWLVEALDG